MSLEATYLLTQEAKPIRTTLVDACNGFNELSRLEMMWNIQHFWLVGERFSFNCYKHWEKLLLRQLVEPPVTLMIREGVTQCDPSRRSFMG